MNVFHRLVETHPERGPIFSVANIMKPGSFDMAQIQSLETPAIAFFLTLPAPINALDAWEAMEPIARRMAELLDGVGLDGRSEEHTSELPSLMRISYAVFCLNKKKQDLPPQP